MATSSADILKSTQPGVISGHLLNGVRVSSAASQHAWQTMADTRGDVVRIDIPADPQARVAFVRRWMAKNQKALKNTGMAATLVLPLMAQQALADSNVAINDLQGVAEVIRMPNGSLTLLMNNGYRIDLAAADVALEGGRVVVDITALMEALSNDSGLLVPLSQLPDVQSWELLPNGDVLITRADGSQMTLARSAVVQQGDLLLISPSSALQYGVAEGTDFGNLLFVPSASFSPAVSGTSIASSSAPVSSFADIPPWLYVGGGAIALGAAAAGGGGGGGGGETGPSTISGYVIDGYISGATVTREFDANSVTTNGSGFFSGLQGSGILTATGGVDISTGLPFTGVLRAPDGSTVITPLTTMMVQLSQQFGLNNSDAESVIKTALGLDDRLNLLTTDPLAEASANVDLLIAGVKVASLLSMAATAGISSADALSRLASAFNQASENGRELTNQEMADALGLPSIAGQVKQALDAIDAAGVNLDLDAYREGANNPLRSAQRDAQDPNSELSNTLEARADLPYLTLQQALTLAQNGELPDQYLINPGQPFDAGMLGLTAAGNQLGLVEMILAGDFDVDTAPIGLGSVYTWSIRADAEDVLVSGGLGRPEVVGAQSVTLTNATIRPDQFADLNTLNNFVLGNTVVPYTLEEALGTDDMPANYTLAPGALFNAGNVTVREAAELINNTRQLLDLAQNTGSDGLTRSMLLEWHIVDSLANILATPSARPQINQAESIRVTEMIITPAQFVQLDALVNFVLGDTEVDYTLAEALAADPLASNYIINLDKVLDAGTVTVAQAEGTFADVSRILEGANNQPPLTLFVWEISDTAEAIIADLDQGHVIEANQVSANNRVITSAQFDQLNALENFELGATIVRYTLENAVNAESLAANYDIDTTVPFEAGEVSVDEAAATLEVVERILDGALNTQTPDADGLFNWTVVDSASAILEAIEEGSVPHLTRANAVNVSDDIITIAQFEALSAAEFNYVRLDELVEYTLANAISVIDDGDGPLVDSYVIDLDTSFDEVWTVAEGESYFAIIAGAENQAALLASDAVVWQIEDSISNLLNGISNVNADDDAFDNDAILNAETVRVKGEEITQAQYEELLGVVEDALRLDAGEDALRTTVTYADLEAAVGAEAGGVLAPSEFYSITGNTPYTNANGALRVANALTEIETVKSILEGSTDRDAANFEAFYNWSITDSASDILAVIENSTSGIPEVLEGADSIFVANGGADGNILAAEYDALVDGLGEDGFDYNEVAYTLTYVFDEATETFAAPGDLAERFFFTRDVFDIDEAVGEGSINVADAAGYYSAVLALVNASTDNLSVTDIYEWSVLDSAAAIVTAYTNNGSQHPPHIRDATLVEINDTAVITFEQYAILDQIAGFEIQSYTLEEAVGIYLEDNSGLATNYIIDDSTAYLAEALSVEKALEYRNAVGLIVDEGEQSARNARLDSAALDELYSWTVSDFAIVILDAEDTNGRFSGAVEVSVRDDILTLQQRDQLVAKLGDVFVLGETPVRFIFNESLTLGDMLSVSERYEIQTEEPKESFSFVTVAKAEARYKATEEIVNGAINSQEISVEILQSWEITAAQLDSLFNAIEVNAPWVKNADKVALAKTDLTPEQYEAFLDLGNVDLNDVVVFYTLEQAYNIIDSDSSLPQPSNDRRPGSYEVKMSTPFDAGALTVEETKDLLAKVDDILLGANNEDALADVDLLSWTVEDDADSLIAAVNTIEIQKADLVSVNTGDIGYKDFEALSVLDNFNKAGLTVTYPLGELVQRSLSGEDLPQRYALDVSNEKFFAVGELDVYAAERLYNTSIDLIAGAVNNDNLELSSLVSWVVKDTFENIYEINVEDNGGVASEFLVSDAVENVVVVGSILDDSQSQKLRFALGGFDKFSNEQDGQPGGSITQLSKTFLVNGQPDGDVDLITDFRVGDADGRDELFIDLTASDVEMLRGFEASNVMDGIYRAGFGKYDVNQDGIGTGTLADADIAFAVFTTAEFGVEGADWLSQLGLANDEVVYLLAGNSDTSEDPDDALLLRVSFSGEDINTQALANFENLDLNNFLEENWNTNYSFT